MPRRNRRPSARSVRSGSPISQRVERGPAGDDGDYYVRTVLASSAAKGYLCPGCNGHIRPATTHVVAWPVEDAELRRHWHTGCWRGRTTRTGYR